MILYLHGFRSSPASFKARLLAAELQRLGLAHLWHCPQLPASPRAAVTLATDLACATQPHELTVIGSSLGGYYATWLAEKLGCRAVLLNPAVNAADKLAPHVGEHQQYHSDEPFIFLPEYVDELRELNIQSITRPERYLLLAATGDELLDWREMRDHYPGAHHIIIEGSDHGLSDFAQWMPQVLAFAGVNVSDAANPSTARPLSTGANRGGQ